MAALVSARLNVADVVDGLTDRVQGLGAVVVGCMIQRRGFSRGGVATMQRPLSASTLVGPGKSLELALLCQQTAATVVVFHNTLSGTRVCHLEALTRVVEVAALAT